MNGSERIGALIFGYLRNELSPAEQEELRDWRNASVDNEKIFQKETSMEGLREDFKRMTESKELVWQKIADNYPMEEKGSRIIESRFSWLWSAAAVLLIGLGLYFPLFRRGSTSKHSGSTQYEATITIKGVTTALDDFHRGLMDGLAGVEVIENSNGELVYLASNDSFADRHVYNSMETKRGNLFSLKFPDGTQIWLNPQSSIRFPANLTMDTLKVELSGAAYLEIPSTIKSKFRMHVQDMEIEFGPGRFNLQAYPDEKEIRVIVLEGNARIWSDSSGNTTNAQNLTAGQEARVVNREISLLPGVSDTSAWKRGQSCFHEETADFILRAVSRKYDLDIKYQGMPPSGKYSLCLPVSAELKEIKDILGKVGIKVE